MQYAKIVEGAVVRVGSLPRNLKTETNTIINFNRLSDTDLKVHGYLPVTDETPQHDSKYTSLGAPEYVVGIDNVVLTHTIATMDLLAYKQQVITGIYEKAKQLLDRLAAGYSLAEIATWPAIQADVIVYNDTAVIGSALQAATDASSYDVAGIVALLTPRIVLQASVIATRKLLVESVTTAVDHAAVAAIDITTSW